MSEELFCRTAQGYIAYGLNVPAANVLEVDDPEGFHFFGREDLNLLVWRRGTSAPRLDALVATTRDARDLEVEPAVLRAGSLTADVSRFVQSRYEPASDASMALAVDLFDLSSLLLNLTGAPAIRSRFERVEHDGCRLFHTDKNTLRLLCTYAGAGTQWLPDAAVDRSALGKGSNAAICSNTRAVRSIRRGDVALLKGDAWPGNAGRGIVHRSPPIAKSGQSRLLLTLDLLAG
jgi:hypothetical protein